MTEIILRCSGQTIPTHVLCYRIWTHINDPFTHPQSEVKTVYAEFFDPWDWVIIHGLYEDDVNAQLFQWALDSAFIVMIILFTLSRSALYLSGSIIQPRIKDLGYMQYLARGSDDLNGRLEHVGAD